MSADIISVVYSVSAAVPAPQQLKEEKGGKEERGKEERGKEGREEGREERGKEEREREGGGEREKGSQPPFVHAFKLTIYSLQYNVF